ncbi:hypothetical protein WICMUC_000374 [Wickerhamomyces mucosus]|uniref:assimilatory sulfite reductase (NADPH) n=1 Tax=Wickerhamomyces mucosus TaxID=1378264 RepID=A0A9P8PZA2_9ASCO|nr:hypothetical protein WICMUC_000374 [Wickerhamomyces mucosus]
MSIYNYTYKEFVDILPLINQSSNLYQIKLDENSDYQLIHNVKDLGIVLISTSKDQILSHTLLSNLLFNNKFNVFHFYNVEFLPTIIEYQSLINNKIDSLQSGIELLSSNGFNVEYFTHYKPWSFTSINTSLIHLGSYYESLKSNLPSNYSIVRINILPLNLTKLFEILSNSINSITILQQSLQKPIGQFSTLLLEFFQDQSLINNSIDKISSSSISSNYEKFAEIFQIIDSNLKLDIPLQNLFFGIENNNKSLISNDELIKLEKIQSLESSYLNILNQLFNQNNELNILNQFQSKNLNELNPSFAFGKYLYHKEQQLKLIQLIKNSLDSSIIKSDELIKYLQNWLINPSNDNIDEIKKLLIKEFNDDDEILKLKDYFTITQNWLITSDSWSNDLGNSGLHQLLKSNENVNLLVVDNETYDSKVQNLSQKKDIGLYALNYGNSYVGSIAIYSSYTQVLTTLIEASKFKGPSIILAYLPIKDENDSHLDILQNTKKSVETGFIPLYRFNPHLSNESEIFKLDSSIIKENLQKFLDRENKLTLLTSKNPLFARSLSQSNSTKITQEIKSKSSKAYTDLLTSLSKGNLSIYYASDGGQAENLSKNLAKKLIRLGLTIKIGSMDEIELDQLPNEENVVFITSTSGQGEFPQNGKKLWDSIKSANDLNLEFIKIAVFGLGDSLYWPRPQDKHYYNKPAVDLHKRLLTLGAKEIIGLGLGNDQDSDGHKTNYKPWELELINSFGLDASASNDPPPITNEDIKIGSNFLRGTIAEGLKDESTGAIAAPDQQLTKFHGIYMQDDRDLRDARKASGLEPFYIFMARVRLPGGITTPEQWLSLDELSDERANGTIKLTTRATFQLHGIVKHNLKPAIRKMNSVLMDTLGACGDVNRNVMISALPHNAKIHAQVDEVAKRISEHLLPQTTAYHEIWLQGPDPEDDSKDWPEKFNERKNGPKKFLVAGDAVQDVEPLYGPTYLPRKYKINITVPPYNDVDVWSSDVGLVAIVENNETIGFNVLVGGGMGSTHNNKKTYPRTGSNFGFVTADKVHIVCEKVMLVQRDFGNRKDRKNARLKYTVDTLGVEGYKAKVEEYWGEKFQPARDFEIKDNVDHFGWVTDELGLNHFTCFIENGRVENTPELPQKTGFRKVAEYFKSNPNSKGNFRLTGNQHVLISSVSKDELDDIKQILAEYKLDNTNFSGLRLSSAACVAFPTCGLAMAESERYLPVLVTKLEEYLETIGLRHDSIVMRMTGCPNGCARPWLAEVALVGKAYGVYNLMLGGGYHGQRLNKIYKQNLKEEEILATLKPLFKRWGLERQEGEHFGDFLIRVGVIKPTLEGKYFHDDIPEDA